MHLINYVIVLNEIYLRFVNLHCQGAKVPILATNVDESTNGTCRSHVTVHVHVRSWEPFSTNTHVHVHVSPAIMVILVGVHVLEKACCLGLF